MDKRSLELVVAANTLKDGKPSIYSTRQMGFFKDLSRYKKL